MFKKNGYILAILFMMNILRQSYNFIVIYIE